MSWTSSNSIYLHALLLFLTALACFADVNKHRLVMSAKKRRDPSVLGPKWTQWITGNELWISLQPDWQISNPLVNSSGQSCQVLKSWYIGGGPQQVFQCCFADSLNQKLISICGADATTDPPTLLGRFIINHGEGSKNITFKMISHFFKLLHINYSLLKPPNVGGFPWHWFLWGPHSSLERERKTHRCLLTSSIKCEIGHFPKRCFHMQSCCFTIAFFMFSLLSPL